MNPISTALLNGYSALQILQYLKNLSPGLKKQISSAEKIGYKSEQILDFLSNKMESDFSSSYQTSNKIEGRKKQEYADKVKKAVGLGLGGVAIGAYALSRALPSAASNITASGAIRPSAILPAQPPRNLPGQTPRGLPHLGARAPGPAQPRPVAPVPPMTPQVRTQASPTIRPTGQPVQTPSVIPMGGPQAPKMSGGQILQNLGLMATLSNLARNNPNLSAQDIAGVLKTVEPAKVGQLVKDKSVNLPQIVEEALQELQTQPQQQPQAQQSELMEPEGMQLEPRQPEVERPQMPIQTTERIEPKLPLTAKEKIESATYAPAFLKKLSEHDISKRQFSIPTYKLPSESPQDFANREIMDSAIIKAAKALEEEKSFLDFPEPWGKAYIEEKVISRGPRKGVVEKTGKSPDIYDRSTAADVLRFMSGVPNVYDALLDEDEKKELNQRLIYGHENIQAATPSDDANIYGAQMTPNLVWNLLLSVEPRLQTVDKPKSVKGHKMSPGGVMGSTEFRRYLTHAVYGALSGKTITTQLADKIQKISKAAMETDALAEAAKTGRLNAAIEEQERLMKDDDYFFSLFTEEIQRKAQELR